MYSSRAPLFALLLLLACTSAPDDHDRPWKIELTSSGGFAGRGNGAFAIDSTGAIAITTSELTRCTFTATADELRRFETLIDQARPENWRPSYVPENKCCDRFEWRLKLEDGGRAYETEWIDDPLPMPAELTALADAITSPRDPASLRSRYYERCRTGSR